MVDTTQDWFLSAAWQDGEKAASADIAAGRITRDYSDDEFLASFDDAMSTERVKDLPEA